MLNQILATVTAWIVACIAALGYPGVALLMAIESACVPLPSEIIMPFAGYLAFKGQFSLVGAATIGAIGCNFGSTVAYLIAARGGRTAVERWGRYILLRPGELAQSERFFARYGSATVFIGRLLPIVRTFIAFPAGLARMPMLRFQVFTFVGSWLWCFALAYAGFLLGERWETDPTLQDILHRFDAMIVLVIFAGLGWFIWSRLRRGE